MHSSNMICEPTTAKECYMLDVKAKPKQVLFECLRLSSTCEVVRVHVLRGFLSSIDEISVRDMSKGCRLPRSS
jgi:hypothetical protein